MIEEEKENPVLKTENEGDNEERNNVIEEEKENPVLITVNEGNNEEINNMAEEPKENSALISVVERGISVDIENQPKRQEHAASADSSKKNVENDD